MKYYECDECKKQYCSELPVMIEGITMPGEGGLLIPGWDARRREFCDPTCAWKWLDKVKERTPPKRGS